MEFRVLRIIGPAPEESNLVVFYSLPFLHECRRQMQKAVGGRSAASHFPAIRMQNGETEEISREEYEALLIAAGKYVLFPSLLSRHLSLCVTQRLLMLVTFCECMPLHALQLIANWSDFSGKKLLLLRPILSAAWVACEYITIVQDKLMAPTVCLVE